MSSLLGTWTYAHKTQGQNGDLGGRGQTNTRIGCTLCENVGDTHYSDTDNKTGYALKKYLQFQHLGNQKQNLELKASHKHTSLESAWATNPFLRQPIVFRKDFLPHGQSELLLLVSWLELGWLLQLTCDFIVIGPLEL